MKKITTWLLALCLTVFVWQGNAQYSCDTGVPLSDGYTQTGITTDGDGTQSWASAPGDSCGLSWRYWGEDDYLFTYTSETAESLALTLLINGNTTLSGIFTNCDGATLSGCLASGYAEKDGELVLETKLEANQTVYVLVSEFAGASVGLNFDVTNFSVTEITCPEPKNITLDEKELESVTLSWEAGGDETAWYYVVQEKGTGTPTGTEVKTEDNPAVISGLMPSTEYEFFLKASCAEDDSSEWVGPFYFETEISCPVPSTIELVETTKETATLSWSAGSDETEWIYIIQEKGPGQPIMAEVATTDNPVTISGLTAGTNYEFYLKSDCGDVDGVSEWANGGSPFYFATECDVVSDIFEDFEGSTGRDFPVCWYKVGDGGSAYPQNSPVLEGSRNLYMKSNSEDDRAVVALPMVNNADLGTYQIRMKVKAIVAAQAGQTLEFGYLTDPLDAETFVVISSTVATSTDVQEFIAIPKNMPSANMTFALRTGVLNKNLAIDDVSWELAPTCPTPGGLNVTDIEANSAILNWVENGSSTNWEIEYGEEGFEPTGIPNIENITDTSYLVEGLDPASNYAFYVRSNCGEGDLSTWTGPYTFVTACPVYTAPYEQDFSNAVYTDHSGNPDVCWTEGNDTDIAEGPNGENGSWRATGFLGSGSTGSLSYNFFQNTAQKDWLVSPEMDLSGADKGLALNIAIGSSTSTTEGQATTMQEGDEVKLLISEDNGATWAAIYTWNSDNQPAFEETQEYIIDVSSYASSAVQFAFWANNGQVENKNYVFYIDDFIMNDYATLSVDQLDEAHAFTYFPNPVSSTLTLKSQFQIEAIQIYNVVGQKIKTVNPNSVNSELDLSTLPTGPYFVKVTTNGLTKTVRVIKK